MTGANRAWSASWSKTRAAASTSCAWAGKPDAGDDAQVLWGVGIDGDIATASLKAIVSAVNRAIRTRERSGALAAV